MGRRKKKRKREETKRRITTRSKNLFCYYSLDTSSPPSERFPFVTHIHRLQIADDASSLRRVEKFGEHDGRLPARTSLSKSFHRIKHVEFFVNAYDRAFRGLRISHLYTYYRSAFFCSSSYNFLYIIIDKHTHSLSLSLPLSLTHIHIHYARNNIIFV